MFSDMNQPNQSLILFNLKEKDNIILYTIFSFYILYYLYSLVFIIFHNIFDTCLSKIYFKNLSSRDAANCKSLRKPIFLNF